MMKAFRKTLFSALVLSMIAICAMFCTTGISAAEVADSGTCGENIAWTLYDDGSLVISGEGSTPDYFMWQSAPWIRYNADIQTVIVEEGISGLGNFAFHSLKNVTEVSLPKTLKVIGENAFDTCRSLEKLTIPENTTLIKEYAFRWCEKLNRMEVLSPFVIFSGEVQFQGVSSELVLYGYEGSTTDLFAADNGMKFEAFEGPAVDISKVVAASGKCGENVNWTLYANGNFVLSGEGRMFDYLNSASQPWAAYSRSIRTVTVEEGVTAIGRNAFSSTAVRRVNLADSVSEIGMMAFFFCSNLQEIEISNAVVSIGENAFARCAELKRITVAEDNPQYTSDEYGVLFKKEKKALLQYPTGSSEKEYTIPDTVTVIGSYAFSDCAAIEIIRFPAGVRSFNLMAFVDCTSLKAFVVDEANGAFSADENGVLFSKDGTKLYQFPLGSKSVSYDVPEGVTEIGEYAFFGSSLEGIEIPEGVKVINRMAFGSCGSLQNVTIPSTVTVIGGNSFDGCFNLKSMTVYSPYAEFSGNVFSGSKSDFCMYGYEGSTAESYAAEKKLKFSAIEDPRTVVGSGACGENVTWTLYDDGALVISGEGAMTNWESADAAPWSPMKDINNEQQVKIKTLIIQNGVTSVGDYAFFGCDALVDLMMADSVVRIGSNAFASCSSLTSFNVLDNIEEIGERAFAHCISLETFYLSYGNLHFSVRDGVLFTEDMSVLMHYPAAKAGTRYTVPFGVETIDTFAFSNCRNLQKLSITSETVTLIKPFAIFNCQLLETIELSSSVNQISSDSFMDNYALKSFVVSEFSPYFTTDDRGVLFTKDKRILFNYPSGREETVYTVPETVTDIRYSAFANTVLETIALPDGLERIDICAFSGCENLKEIMIPASVTLIDTSAFMYCTSLNSVTVYAIQARFGRDVFENTSDSLILKGIAGSTTEAYAKENGIDFEAVEREIRASGQCGENLTWILYTDGEMIIRGEGKMTNWEGSWVVPWQNYFKDIRRVTIETGVVSLGDYSFDGFESITEVSFPDTLTYIGAYSFIRCRSLKEVRLPASVETVGVGAFSMCTSLTGIYVDENNPWLSSDWNEGVLFNKDKSILIQYPAGKRDKTYSIPESVVEIGQEAIRLSNLNELIIPNSVKRIGVMGIFNSINLQTLTIPASVEFIGESAVGSCWSLTSINVAEENPNYTSVDGILFDKKLEVLICYPHGKTETSYTIPRTVKTIGPEAFNSNIVLNDVVFPEGLVSIEHHAFFGCTQLTSATAPSTVKYIGTQAFSYCEKLKSVTVLSKDATFKGGSVFSGNPADFVLYGYAGSTAEAFAEEYGVAFSVLTAKEILGDINMDGNVDIGDALQLFMYSMLPDQYQISYTGNVDFNKDNSVDIGDALQLFMYSMLPDEYPIA